MTTLPSLRPSLGFESLSFDSTSNGPNNIKAKKDVWLERQNIDVLSLFPPAPMPAAGVVPENFDAPPPLPPPPVPTHLLQDATAPLYPGTVAANLNSAVNINTIAKKTTTDTTSGSFSEFDFDADNVSPATDLLASSFGGTAATYDPFSQAIQPAAISAFVGMELLDLPPCTPAPPIPSDATPTGSRRPSAQDELFMSISVGETGSNLHRHSMNSNLIFDSVSGSASSVSCALSSSFSSVSLFPPQSSIAQKFLMDSASTSGGSLSYSSDFMNSSPNNFHGDRMLRDVVYNVGTGMCSPPPHTFKIILYSYFEV